MRTFGLVGYPLSHSFSKRYFEEKFEEDSILDCNYELFPLDEIAQLGTLLSSIPLLCGLNVTIPYKISVMPFLNEFEEAALQIGAVNCISIGQKDGVSWLKGYNTDAYGFEESLKPLLKGHHQKALIFGDGGAARAIKYVLLRLGISFLVVGRKPAPGSILYGEVTPDVLKAYTVLINTTPLGMYPNTNSCPDIPYPALSEQHLAYDLVYNPEVSLFLQQVTARGGAIKNGMEMLHLQAERSWHIWNA